LVNGEEPQPIEQVPMDRRQGLAPQIRPRGESASPWVAPVRTLLLFLFDQEAVGVGQRFV